MKMIVSEVTVLVNEHGTDSILILTDLPNGCYPYVGCATAEIKVASRKGEEYAKANFPDIIARVVNLSV